MFVFFHSKSTMILMAKEDELLLNGISFNALVRAGKIAAASTKMPKFRVPCSAITPTNGSMPFVQAHQKKRWRISRIAVTMHTHDLPMDYSLSAVKTLMYRVSRKPNRTFLKKITNVNTSLSWVPS
jgi:hypothetical protein